MSTKEINSLYIIGNGFDCLHKLPTRYFDFYTFCKKFEQGSFLWDVNDIFPDLDDKEKNWNNFEAQLSNFYVDSTISNGIQDDQKSLECYSDDFDDHELVSPFIDSHLQRYEDTIAKLHQKFKEWIESIEIKTNISVLKINNNSVFLSFNYTKTLEVIYGIDREKVCYIHGKAGDEELVFGHNWEYKVKADPLEDRLYVDPDDQIIDTLNDKVIEEPELKQLQQSYSRSESDNKIFSEFKKQIISPLQKNCTDIIENTSFFEELEELNIKKIFVLGHSLSEVDMPYFDEIIQRVNDVMWIISYYKDDDLKNIELFKKRFNLDCDCCEIIQLDDLQK